MLTYILITILAIFLGLNSIFLDEKDYGVITQSGEIVKVVFEPGIHIKIPIVQKVDLIHQVPAFAEAEFQAFSIDKNSMHVKARDYYEVDPSVSYPAKKRISKLVEPYGIKIRQIDAKAKTRTP